MSDDYTIKSCEKRDFDSGAKRNKATGKGRMDLLPFQTLIDLAKHYEKGITDANYEARNWEKGIPLSSFFESGIRHAFEWFLGKDDEDGEDHLIAAIWNFVGLKETLNRINKGILPKELNDVPFTYNITKLNTKASSKSFTCPKCGRKYENIQIEPGQYYVCECGNRNF